MQTLVLPSEALTSNEVFEESFFQEDENTAARFLSIELEHFNVMMEESVKSEIIEDQGLCKIPFTPKWFTGVINVRGNSVPIIDLNEYLYDINSNKKMKPYVLIIGEDKNKCGLLLRQLPKAVSFDKAQRVSGQFQISSALKDHTLDIYESSGLWIHANLLGLFTEAMGNIQ